MEASPQTVLALIGLSKNNTGGKSNIFFRIVYFMNESFTFNLETFKRSMGGVIQTYNYTYKT